MTIHYADFSAAIKSELEVIPTVWTVGIDPSTGKIHKDALFKMSPIGQEMLELLPSYYFLGNNVRRIMEIMATDVLTISNDITDLRNQFFVATATWGLRYWEQMLGLPVQDENIDYDTRRAIILAHLQQCDSEKCFVEGLELISGGRVIVILLDPATNP